MKPEIFAEFLTRLGHHVVKTDSCYWYDAFPGFFFFFPHHKPVSPSREEFRVLFKRRFCVGARFFSPMSCFGKESYLIKCSDKNYDITCVDAKYGRRQTRRGLENFEIKLFDFESLAIQGLPAIHDTLSRQGRDPGIWPKTQWHQYCTATRGLDGFEAWGAFQGDQLAAFIMGFQMLDHFTIVHHYSRTEYLRQYPNNALVFYLTKLKLQTDGVNHVYYGPQSLDAPDSLDQFKFRMGFEQEPIKQCFVFSPVIKPFVNRLTYKVVASFSASKPESDTLRKVLGVFEGYLGAV